MSHPEATVLPALAQALAGTRWAGAPLEPLPQKGLAHDHVRLAGTGLLARIPRQSQLGLAPRDNLAYQRACFARAEPSGRTPRLAGHLPPSKGLPRGALMVEEIVGRPARLPQDLDALAEALARLHALALAPAGRRAPVLAPNDALQAMVDEIALQARHLDAAGLPRAVCDAARGGLDRLREHARQVPRPGVHLIAFDAHPANFIVRADGTAVLVDLEKCRYAFPGFDLAHATLYTSTTWDTASHAVLSPPEVAQFHAAWERRMPADAAAAARAWHVPLRRAMWLWSLTWCAKWRVFAARAPDPSHRGEDWSAASADEALVRHVRERTDHFLSQAVVERVAADIDALARLLPA
jgi:thiamine kinase-like enzyme